MTQNTAKQFSPELRERAVWMVQDREREGGSQWESIGAIAAKFGCSHETLRRWVRQGERDAGERPGLTTDQPMEGRSRAPRPAIVNGAEEMIMADQLQLDRYDEKTTGRADPTVNKRPPPDIPPAELGQEPHGDQPSGKAPLRDGKGRKPSKWRCALYSTVALAVLAVAGYGGYRYWDESIRPFESTDDAFVDARSFSVAPKVSGYIVEAPVTDNQHVEAGDELFQIDPRDYRTALAQVDAQVQAATATIENVAAQIDEQGARVELAKAQVNEKTALLQFAQQDAVRYRDLAHTGFGTVQRDQSASSALLQQQAALAEAQANVVASERNVQTLKAQRAVAEAQLASSKAQADQARLNLSYARVTAARSGKLVQLTAGVGAFAQAGQSLAMFVPDEVWVTANFKETQLTDIRPGQDVSIEIDAYPDHELKGRVASVQPGSGTAFSLLPAQNATGNYVKVTQRVPVKIVVEDWPPNVAIGPGMSVLPTVRVR